jgi:hypothetical protein
MSVGVSRLISSVTNSLSENISLILSLSIIVLLKINYQRPSVLVITTLDATPIREIMADATPSAALAVPTSTSDHCN